jgi:23S rRNA (guanosine2251-2'-O)-methyltransferase
MSDKRSGKPPSEAHDRHHAELRRKRREASRASGAKRPPQPDEVPEGRVHLYGLHTVRHALANSRRRKHVLMATRNALSRLEAEPAWLERVEVREVEPDRIARLLPLEAVHQGVLLEAEPLPVRSLRELSASPLLLVLDQVTDPHNVGAIMRSAVALGAGALITTNRHSPAESGVLAKSASGALDMIEHVGVRNLAETLQELAGLGYQTVGLDSEGPQTIENSLQSPKIALVLGAEGKGLRQKTRETCTTLARIDLPGEIRSLNVSNAAVLALYIARRHVDSQ